MTPRARGDVTSRDAGHVDWFSGTGGDGRQLDPPVRQARHLVGRARRVGLGEELGLDLVERASIGVDVADGHVLVSTGTDRQKDRNVRRDPRVSVSVLDPDDPYRCLEVRGRVIEVEPDPRTAFLDRLARKYLGEETYPYPQRRDVERVVLHIRPGRVVAG